VRASERVKHSVLTLSRCPGYGACWMVKPFAEGPRLTVAVLGTGRLGETHLAALALSGDWAVPGWIAP